MTRPPAALWVAVAYAIVLFGPAALLTYAITRSTP